MVTTCGCPDNRAAAFPSRRNRLRSSSSRASISASSLITTGRPSSVSSATKISPIPPADSRRGLAYRGGSWVEAGWDMSRHCPTAVTAKRSARWSRSRAGSSTTTRPWPAEPGPSWLTWDGPVQSLRSRSELVGGFDRLGERHVGLSLRAALLHGGRDVGVVREKPVECCGAFPLVDRDHESVADAEPVMDRSLGFRLLADLLQQVGAVRDEPAECVGVTGELDCHQNAHKPLLHSCSAA